MPDHGGQRKCTDIVWGTTFAVGAAGITINSIYEGASFYQRIGRKICNNLLQIKGWIKLAGGIGPTANQEDLKIRVVYDKQANGTQPANADIVLSVTQAAVSSSTVLDHNNLNNRDRFLTLYENWWSMPQITAAGTPLARSPAMQDKLVIVDVDLKGLETIYNGNTGTYADISTGSISMQIIGSAGSQYTFYGTSRLWFQDS